MRWLLLSTLVLAMSSSGQIQKCYANHSFPNSSDCSNFFVIRGNSLITNKGQYSVLHFLPKRSDFLLEMLKFELKFLMLIQDNSTNVSTQWSDGNTVMSTESSRGHLLFFFTLDGHAICLSFRQPVFQFILLTQKVGIEIKHDLRLCTNLLLRNTWCPGL
jgi:hypothetical protein